MLDQVPEKQSDWNCYWDYINVMGPHLEPKSCFLALCDLVTPGKGPDVALGVRRRLGDASTSGEASISRHSSGSWKSSPIEMTHGFVKSC